MLPPNLRNGVDTNRPIYQIFLVQFVEKYGGTMPERETLERAREDAREGKSPSTQAGEFVREEIHHVREGKHGVRNAKQAIAIGLSKARKAGVKLPPAPGQTDSSHRSSKTSGSRASRPSRKRSQATLKALKKERRVGASSSALARQTRKAAQTRSKSDRSQAGRKAAHTRKRASSSR